MQQYLDYVNIMSYDLHGAWNEYVGPNASLFDDGKDGELAAANVYGSAQYGNIGYLNTDWAYHYFRGSIAGKPVSTSACPTTPAATRTCRAARTACGARPPRPPARPAPV